MKRFLVLGLLVLCASCAQMKQTITETSTTADGKSVVKTTNSDSKCEGFGCNAGRLASLEIRRQEVADAGAVAKAAVAKGMPTTLGQDASRSDTQAGYQFGQYGYGYGYGQYGAGSALAMTEYASLGGGTGYLPRLGEQPVYVQPPQAQPVQAGGSTSAVCPKDRASVTQAERLACIEEDQTVLMKKVGKIERGK
jgi:hypothetical protein